MTQIRLIAGIDGANVYAEPAGLEVVARLLPNTDYESLESPEDTENKAGLPQVWIKVKAADGKTGYVGAWLVQLIMEDLLDARSGEWRDVRQDKPDLTEAQFAKPDKEEPKESVVTKPDEMLKTQNVPIVDPKQEEITPSRIPIRVKSNLNLRDKPEDGKVIQVAYPGAILISLESDAETQRKVGTKGEWLNIQTIYGKQAYAAAWFLEPYDGAVPQPVAIPKARSRMGINLDVYNPLGKPDPQLLDGIGWARLAYNHSRNAKFPHGTEQGHGNLDVNVSDAEYGPYLRALKQAGLKTILVFTHQTWGEGRGFDFASWGENKDEQWVADKWRNEFAPNFISKLQEITRLYEPEGLIDVYQIWNEPDYQGSPRAQILMNSKNFGYLLSKSVEAIKAIDSDAIVITGGHTSGPGKGPDLMREALAEIRRMKGAEPDGVAFHPYGRGLGVDRPFSHFGAISESITRYAAVLPGKPVWMTEWGVLSPNHQPWFTLGNEVPSPNAIYEYAQEFMNEVQSKFADDVVSAVWYGWAIGMDDGYGIVNERQEPLEPFYSGFKKL